MPPSIVSLSKLELKPLPDSIKYVFLALKRPYLSLSFLLSCYQEQELIRILSNLKGAIGWLVVDLKGISPTICMHRIQL